MPTCLFSYHAIFIKDLTRPALTRPLYLPARRVEVAGAVLATDWVKGGLLRGRLAAPLPALLHSGRPLVGAEQLLLQLQGGEAELSLESLELQTSLASLILSPSPALPALPDLAELFSLYSLHIHSFQLQLGLPGGGGYLQEQLSRLAAGLNTSRRARVSGYAYTTERCTVCRCRS